MFRNKLLISASLAVAATLSAFAGSPAGQGSVPQWFRDAVIYQVYPSAFADSDGDGMGDIPGITQRLDYVKSLGCNTIWINACFDSQFRDGGYDVTDYYRVAPRYGSNADMRALLEAAHGRGLRVLLDLVAGHTSDRHPWFLQSRRRGRNEFSDRYIWTADTAVCPPKFVVTASTDSTRFGNYLKNYFPFQPALNYGYGIVDPAHPWEQPLSAPGPTATRRELMRIMDFWADMGCDGFRVDMAGSLVKNDPSLSATQKLWNEVRDHYRAAHPDGILLAEWGHPEKARRIGFTADFLFQFGISGWRDLFCNEVGVYRRDTCYFDTSGIGTPCRFISALLSSLDSVGSDALVCLPTGNHDVQRLNCGRRSDPAELKTALAFLLSMPCVPCVYYGDEIGMRYREGLPDIEGSVIAAGNRAGSRTPMEWGRVPAQQADSASVFNAVRRLLQLRRDYPALGTAGSVQFLSNAAPAGQSVDPYPLAFVRRLGDETVFVAVNPSGRQVSAAYVIPDAAAKTPVPLMPVADGCGVSLSGPEVAITLKPVSYIIYQLQ